MLSIMNNTFQQLGSAEKHDVGGKSLGMYLLTVKHTLFPTRTSLWEFFYSLKQKLICVQLGIGGKKI